MTVLPQLSDDLAEAADRLAHRPGKRLEIVRAGFRRPRLVLAALTGGVVVVVAAIGIGGLGGDADAPTPSPVRAAASPRAATVPASTVRKARLEFAVFRAPAGSRAEGQAPPARRADGKIADDANLFARFPTQMTTVDPQNARRLNVPGRDVWVAPGDREGVPQLCMQMRSMLGPGVRGACGPLASSRKHGLFMSGRPAPDSPNAAKGEYVGLLPDGVATVTFLLRDGRTRKEAVHDNAVAVVSETGVRGVRFFDADGKRQTVHF